MTIKEKVEIRKKMESIFTWTVLITLTLFWMIAGLTVGALVSFSWETAFAQTACGLAMLLYGLAHIIVPFWIYGLAEGRASRLFNEDYYKEKKMRDEEQRLRSIIRSELSKNITDCP